MVKPGRSLRFAVFQGSSVDRCIQASVAVRNGTARAPPAPELLPVLTPVSPTEPLLLAPELPPGDVPLLEPPPASAFEFEVPHAPATRANGIVVRPTATTEERIDRNENLDMIVYIRWEAARRDGVPMQDRAGRD